MLGYVQVPIGLSCRQTNTTTESNKLRYVRSVPLSSVLILAQIAGRFESLLTLSCRPYRKVNWYAQILTTRRPG